MYALILVRFGIHLGERINNRTVYKNTNVIGSLKNETGNEKNSWNTQHRHPSRHTW